MKNAIKYMMGASFLVLALVGCGKNDKAKEETAKPAPEASKDLVVTERPPVVCDDANLKNQVVAKVQEELLNASLTALGDKGQALEQSLKARLEQTQVEVQDIRLERGECQASLHIVLNPQDVEFADKAFKQARLASLDEQAVEKGVSLLGGNRLVADFVYQVDGNAVAMNTANPAITLAGRGLSHAVVAMNQQTKATARQAPARPNIVPPPHVTVTPQPVPRPVNPPAPVATAKTPSPESAILRSEDVPRKERESAQPPAETPAEHQEAPQPKADKAEKVEKTNKSDNADKAPKSEEKAKPAVKDNDTQITVVESDETY